MVTAKENANANGRIIHDGWRLKGKARYTTQAMIISGIAAFLA
tara:strand:+ start:498 stop:626 length:129 start_codon:yes stop_codon:yes gene_type:complete